MCTRVILTHTVYLSHLRLLMHSTQNNTTVALSDDLRHTLAGLINTNLANSISRGTSKAVEFLLLLQGLPESKLLRQQC